jgi:RimJ/RimL family protein N-acetyltransferase/acyl carrier protein
MHTLDARPRVLLDPGALTRRDPAPTAPAPPAPGPTRQIPDFTAFLSELGDAIDLDLTGADRTTRLVDDLGWDSLTMLEALAVLDRYDVALPDDLIGELRTIGDIHHYLRVLATGDPDERAERRSASVHDAYRGPNIQLIPVTERDTDWLFALCATGDHLVQFRMRATTPSPENFRRFLWDHVLTQFIVATHDGKPVGLVSCFEPDFRNRYAYIAAVADPRFESSGLVLEGMTMLISYVFAQFDLRKLYAESLESNFEQYASGSGRVFEVEGRLHDHEYVDGGYQDYVISSVWRSAWREHHCRILGTAPPF